MNKEEKELKLKERLAEMSEFENDLRARGVVNIVGVDEVGRGPLAGPVCAAAVVLPEGFDVLGVDDSKKITEKRREILYAEITEKALAWGIGLVDNRRIDEINILNATKEAMLAAIAEANEMLKTAAGNTAAITRADAHTHTDAGTDTAAGAHTDADTETDAHARIGADTETDAHTAVDTVARAHAIGHLLIDAVALPAAGIPYTAIVKGDSRSVSIAAASIVAKVTRDRMMITFDKVYPGYGFVSNKGYGTKAHYEGIRKLGLTPIHRRTFTD
ncbi:MAG: ribonuclease HII [Clostridiales Family XIII bacterium]|jgi:ribonuclease HII|nr:ribonuclease HII [Clostridiales Family XIII bacterium]